MVQVHFIGWSKSILGLIVFSFIAYYRITTAGEDRSDFSNWIFWWVLLAAYLFTVLGMYFPKSR